MTSNSEWNTATWIVVRSWERLCCYSDAKKASKTSRLKTENPKNTSFRVKKRKKQMRVSWWTMALRRRTLALKTRFSMKCLMTSKDLKLSRMTKSRPKRTHKQQEKVWQTMNGVALKSVKQCQMTSQTGSHTSTILRFQRATTQAKSPLFHTFRKTTWATLRMK